jgi:hypothetical protein
MHLGSLTYMQFQRRINLKICHFYPSQRPQGAGVQKFTIHVPLVLKMHHTKFEKNWSSVYQEEVKNVQLTDGGRQRTKTESNRTQVSKKK